MVAVFYHKGKWSVAELYSAMISGDGVWQPYSAITSGDVVWHITSGD